MVCILGIKGTQSWEIKIKAIVEKCNKARNKMVAEKWRGKKKKEGFESIVKSQSIRITVFVALLLSAMKQMLKKDMDLGTKDLSV